MGAGKDVVWGSEEAAWTDGDGRGGDAESEIECGVTGYGGADFGHE